MIKLEEMFLIHHEDCPHMKERDLLKAINTKCHDGCQWYEAQAEIFPCNCRWWKPHRWFVEMSARPSDFPKETRSYWTHYWMHDSRALTLRGAWLKGVKLIWKLNDMFQADPTERPDKETL